MSRDQCIDPSATSYSICKFKTTVHGATFLMTSHVRSALWTLYIISPLYFSGKSCRVRTQFNGQSPSQEECPILCIPNAQWGFAKVTQQPKGRVGRPATRWVIIRWRWLWHTPPSLSLKRRSWQVQFIFYYSVILRSFEVCEVFETSRVDLDSYLYLVLFIFIFWLPIVVGQFFGSCQSMKPV